jgi:hypothetical protein
MHLTDARRTAIHSLASAHGAGRVRWWPNSASRTCLDLLVEHGPDSLPALRSDLERALGCRVAVHAADRIPREAWGKLLVEPVAL